jgi:phage terminase small subunit
MTRKQQVFIKEYLVDLNATRAATAAGYSARTAGEQASRLLANVKIREKVNDSIQKRAQKLEITADRVLSELAKLAFLDPRGFFNPDGSLKAVKDLDDATAASLAGIEHEKLFEHFSKGQAKEVGTTTKIKIADKGINLERLGRHLKLFTDKVEHSGLEGLAEQLAAMRQKKHASGT